MNLNYRSYRAYSDYQPPSHDSLVAETIREMSHHMAFQLYDSVANTTSAREFKVASVRYKLTLEVIRDNEEEDES